MHLLIFRTSGSYLDYMTYNCQELGLAKALAEKGWKVSLVMAGLCEQTINVPVERGKVTIYYLRFKGFNQQLSVFFGWKTLLAKLHPNVIQVHDLGVFMSYLVVRWAKQHRVPCVLIQGNYETTRKPVFRQLEQLYNLTFGKATLRSVAAVGYKTLQAEKFVKNYLPSVKTLATPIGLDASRFDSEKRTRNWVAELGIEGKKVLLYIGSMEQRRNPDFLVRVLQQLPDDYVLLLVGNGPMAVSLQATKPTGRCFMLGKLGQEELPSLYGIASLFLLASNYEIYGMVIMEAMYFGVPVVSSLTAGSETLIQNGVNGCIISTLDEKQWAEKIQAIAGNDIRLVEMSNQARQYIQENLLWSKAADNFIKLYEFAMS